MTITAAVFSFIIMLNPFALFLYLSPIMRDLNTKTFMIVFLKATFISFVIYLTFLFLGDFLFNQVFGIRFDSFRIFGGVVLFSFAYLFIVNGRKAFVQMKGSLDDLASEIALPFMVGAGTVSITILMSQQLSMGEGFLALILSLTTNYILVIALMFLRMSVKAHKLKVAFDKNMEILLRLNGFFLGAIGIDMIITGISHVIEK